MRHTFGILGPAALLHIRQRLVNQDARLALLANAQQGQAKAGAQRELGYPEHSRKGLPSSHACAAPSSQARPAPARLPHPCASQHHPAACDLQRRSQAVHASGQHHHTRLLVGGGDGVLQAYASRVGRASRGAHSHRLEGRRKLGLQRLYSRFRPLPCSRASSYLQRLCVVRLAIPLGPEIFLHIVFDRWGGQRRVAVCRQAGGMRTVDTAPARGPEFRSGAGCDAARCPDRFDAGASVDWMRLAPR